MEAETTHPTATIAIVPYHLPVLEDRKTMAPLVEALAAVCGTAPGDISVRRQEPTQTEGVEAAIIFLMHNPFFLGGVGAVAGGALKRFGENIADWISGAVRGLFKSRDEPEPDRGARDSVSLELVIQPSLEIPEGHRFAVTVPIEIGRTLDQSVGNGEPRDDRPKPPPVYYVMSYSGIGEGNVSRPAELRRAMGASFERIEQPLKILANEMRNSRTPPGITYASLVLDPRTNECWVNGSTVLPDGTDIPYRGTFLRDGMRWDRI
jgi:hypothetical protein